MPAPGLHLAVGRQGHILRPLPDRLHDLLHWCRLFFLGLLSDLVLPPARCLVCLQLPGRGFAAIFFFFLEDAVLCFSSWTLFESMGFLFLWPFFSLLLLLFLFCFPLFLSFSRHLYLVLYTCVRFTYNTFTALFQYICLSLFHSFTYNTTTVPSFYTSPSPSFTHLYTTKSTVLFPLSTN
jgi:hypothetical protein